mmetsp:Transcript_60462/g.184720  ORF Transcript_60462/g.184720 Transcript_60462/m.184720 type:complete len:248 (+) Transcript_60462:1051-1794(+)
MCLLDVGLGQSLERILLLGLRVAHEEHRPEAALAKLGDRLQRAEADVARWRARHRRPPGLVQVLVHARGEIRRIRVFCSDLDALAEVLQDRPVEAQARQAFGACNDVEGGLRLAPQDGSLPECPAPEQLRLDGFALGPAVSCGGLARNEAATVLDDVPHHAVPRPVLLQDQLAGLVVRVGRHVPRELGFFGLEQRREKADFVEEAAISFGLLLRMIRGQALLEVTSRDGVDHGGLPRPQRRDRRGVE